MVVRRHERQGWCVMGSLTYLQLEIVYRNGMGGYQWGRGYYHDAAIDDVIEPPSGKEGS